MILQALFAMICFGFFATPAMAQEADNENACLNAVKQAAKDAAKADGQKLLQLHSQMRSKCKEFRQCKKKCRKAKRSCKKDARGEKKECKNDCKGLSGKAKRQCKKACRKDKRSDKKECRQEKRACKTVCKGAENMPACKSGRKAFWNQVGKTAGSIAKSIGPVCAQEYSKN